MMTPMLVAMHRVLFPCALLLLTGFPTLQERPATKTHRLEIVRMKFSPSNLSVQPGDTVVFINLDMVTHDVTEASGKTWKSPPLAAKSSWKKVMKTSASYYCSFHPVMKGTITVK
ncbi:plastocyanin/azurin family copper-binding protein [Pontibacter sp. HSC-36F09]|uniref:plastocyanin/azurin family copper-binding protein n=1 Tax=Pontibacter sp. HSC-36F09 TaxID=2910966 RepID=UPI00209FFDC3|nr:plastocyanin/azurin family copper-binding protein [Pontibacter sp. HSC-36F09]MCP2043869.1 plastocyanin [Pontibacter sp. HSC-36F09]